MNEYATLVVENIS